MPSDLVAEMFLLESSVFPFELTMSVLQEKIRPLYICKCRILRKVVYLTE
jgi:hypothetical protein